MQASKKSWAMIVAVIALVLAAFGPPSAPAKHAKHPKKVPPPPANFFGMIPLETPSAAELQRMAAGGVETVRVNVSWNIVEPTPGVRDWSYYDRLLGDMAAAGLTPAPIIDGTPSWASQNPRRPPIDNELQRAGWSQFVTDFVSRYGRGGLYWAQHPELPYKPLTTWEVWNEPNLVLEWGGTPSPAEYVSLLRLARDAVLRVEPDARFVFGGLLPDTRPQYGVSGTSFLKSVIRLEGGERLFDTVSLHPFALRPTDVVTTVRSFRTLLDRHGNSQTPLWITELGWSTGGVGDSPTKVSAGRQAVNLKHTYLKLIRVRKKLRLQRVYWHCWRDLDPATTPSWTTQMGVLNNDGTAKPAWKAYQRVARR